MAAAEASPDSAPCAMGCASSACKSMLSSIVFRDFANRGLHSRDPVIVKVARSTANLGVRPPRHSERVTHAHAEVEVVRHPPCQRILANSLADRRHVGCIEKGPHGGAHAVTR